MANDGIAKTRSRLTELLDPQFMARLDALDILSRKILQGKVHGERRSKRRGQSVEFADHRRYVVGDDLRFVDWNIYARLDQLFLKLFLAEEDLTVHVLLDATASMAGGEPPISGADARAALEICRAIYRSGGEPLDLPLADDAELHLELARECE